MSGENKRFFWIKLREDFFRQETIDWLMEQENGSAYVVLYLRLCLMTANTDGELIRTIGDMSIPYDPKNISRKTDIDIDTVNVALALFKRLGLVEETQDGIPVLPGVKEMIGSESESAARVRKYRKNQKEKALQSNNGVTMAKLQCNPEVTDEPLQGNKTTLQSNEELRAQRLEYRDKEIRDKSLEEKPAAAGVDPKDALNSVVMLYQNNIHPITGEIERDRLIDLYTEFGADWLTEAIREAAIHRAGSLAYVQAILRRWKSTGQTRPWEKDRAPKRKAATGNDKQAAKDVVYRLMEQYQQEEDAGGGGNG